MGVTTLFNEDKEPNYATFENIGAILDSLFAEKEERLRLQILAEAKEMLKNQ